jgi:hypothetical protein
MLLADIYPIPIGLSLSVILLVIAASVAASLIWPKEPSAEQEAAVAAATREGDH